MLRGAAVLAALAAAPSLTSAVAQQPGPADPGIMAALLGQCAYREAVWQAQLQQARQQAADLAEYWSRWVK
jgi:hypothetical protein